MNIWSLEGKLEDINIDGKVVNYQMGNIRKFIKLFIISLIK